MKPNDKNKYTVKHLSKDILYNSLAQAVIKIIDTPYLVIKLCLTSFLVCTSGLASYLVTEAIFNFLDFEVTTTTRTIFELPALFPKITICNQNPFTSHYAVDFLKEVNKAFDSSVDLFNPDHLNKLNVRNKSFLIENIHLLAITKMNSKTFNDTERKKLGHRFEYLLFYCKFNRKLCNKDDFVWKFDKLLGNCYVFNSGRDFNNLLVDLKELSIPGMDYGLKLDLYVNYNEKLKIFNSLMGEYGNGIGAKIRIENISFSTDTVDGIDVASGFKTNMAIQRIFKFNLPKP